VHGSVWSVCLSGPYKQPTEIIARADIFSCALSLLSIGARVTKLKVGLLILQRQATLLAITDLLADLVANKRVSVFELNHLRLSQFSKVRHCILGRCSAGRN
jgi:hypothetical protein